MSFKTFFDAYLEAAIWSSTDDDGTPLDQCSRGSVTSETIRALEPDALAFWNEYSELFDGDDAQAGHDFWLTRNRHGAGFWDGDWPKEIGEKLTEASCKFGEIDLYIGDDDVIYAS